MQKQSGRELFWPNVGLNGFYKKRKRDALVFLA